MLLMLLMRGSEPASWVKGWVRRQVSALGGCCLASVSVSSHGASEAYRRNQIRACQEAGILVRPVDVAPSLGILGLIETIRELNGDREVDGIIVQTPLPEGWDLSEVLQAMDPAKDAEGVHPENLGKLFLGVKGHPLPCAAWAAVGLLEWYGLWDLSGMVCAVVGHSVNVGRPIGALLLQRNGTVLQMHKHTPRDVLEELVSSSQVVISATGVPGLIGPGMVRPGAWVVDVGTTPTERGLAGDVDPQCASVAHGLSPVPGGVGPLTVALLMANLVLLASKRRNGRPVELESVRQEA